METADWLEQLSELTAEDVAPARLAQASLDARECENPHDAVQALEEIFWSDVMAPVFNQFGDPSSFYLNKGFPISMIIAAAHPSTPIEILKRLSHTENAYVAWALATNPNTPQAELTALYESDLTIPDPISGDETLIEIWDYPGFEDPAGPSEWPAYYLSVGCAVASNPQIPEGLLDVIINQGDYLELVALARSLILAKSHRLSADQWERLYDRAVASVDDAYTWGRLMMIRPSWPIDICLRILSLDDSELAPWAKGVFGCNDACPTHVIRELAVSSDTRSRWAAASNRSSPQDVLLSLATDPEAEVRAALLANPSASHEARAAATLLD